MAVANNPNQREVWLQTNANVYFSVYQCRRVRFVAVSGATVAQQVQAAINFGAVDRTGEAAPGNIFFLEGLPEDPA